MAGKSGEDASLCPWLLFSLDLVICPDLRCVNRKAVILEDIDLVCVLHS